MKKNETDMIRRLQDHIKTIDEKLQVGHNDPAGIEERIDAVFTERINSFRDYDRRSNAITRNDWEHSVIKRRKQAVGELVRKSEKTYSDKYPELCIADELIRISAPGSALTFDELNKAYDIELAAAIWLLDSLMDNDAYEAAAAYYPKTRESLSEIYLPNLSDSVHSDDALRSMIYLIRNRNKGAEGFDPSKAFIDEAETGYKKKSADTDLPGRKNFDAVIALLDAESIKSVQQQFTAYLDKFTDALLAVVTRRKAEYAETLKTARSELSEMLRQYQDAVPAELSPLMANGDGEVVQVTVSSSEFSQDRVAEAKLRQILSTVEEKEADVERLYSYVQMIPAILQGRLPEEHDRELFEGLDVPEIRCPYEMCFAFLSLLDSNRDEVWCYNLCYDVLAFACQALPWADSGAVDPDNELEELSVDFEYLASLIEKTPDWDDNRTSEILYEKKLHSPLVMPERQLISISQLAFLSSGLVPPRRGNSISFTKAILHDAQLPPEQIELLYEYFSLAYSINHKDDEYLAFEDDNTDEDDSNDADSRNSAEEIKELRGEIKRLKKVIHQLERRTKDAENQLAEANSKAEAANRELAELRTMIRETSDDGENSAVTVSFPYTAKKRSVIIGGHESWVKAIRPLLPDVRFISSSENPNAGVILNAEVVWIQTNALGHSGYYKIIDIVRRNHIKVCYFSFASAEKCAEQFALEDASEDAPESEQE